MNINNPKQHKLYSLVVIADSTLALASLFRKIISKTPILWAIEAIKAKFSSCSCVFV
ncbi:hypothetical protein NCR96_03935 [Helicobacter sp. 14348-15]|uniref:hypothetical protein n=1 Tax=Helicobacter colisuis TaxID=2949739 RepID=UPI00202B4D7C|nr:hypothetical protein [Helicobacter colisuis]MCL9820892.1 hypothetical protein [Helicobacter colisuis]